MNKRRSLSLIVEQTRQAYEMIASIRAFARPPMADARALAVREFFDDWTRRERTRLASLNVEVVAEGVELLNDVVIMSDPSMLCAILDAFGKNAFDALRFKSLQSSLEGSASGAERRKDAVIFFAELSGGDERSVILGVEDSGSGLSRKARELAFSPFYSGRRAGRGLGVGLSKAWRYAEVIGAKIFCEDAKNFDVGCRWSVEHTLLTTPFP